MHLKLFKKTQSRGLEIKLILRGGSEKLQNRVTCCDVILTRSMTSQHVTRKHLKLVTNSDFLLAEKIFELLTRIFCKRKDIST